MPDIFRIQASSSRIGLAWIPEFVADRWISTTAPFIVLRC
jgi:hypothetical protein